MALGERVYVSEIGAQSNRVEVAPRERVLKRFCTLRSVHWTGGKKPDFPLHCEVRPRYRSPAASAVLYDTEEDIEVAFDTPQFALTPGQAAVFYHHQEVLGGGWIERVSTDERV